MNSNPLRLLAIGTDPALAKAPEDAFGDAHQRQLKYASILDRYDMIVRTFGAARLTIDVSEKFAIHPSGSLSRGTYPMDAARLGVAVARSSESTFVSTEDPFLCGLAGYLIARRLGLPLSLQFAGDMIDNPIWIKERPMNRTLNPLGKWLIQRAQSLRVVSTREREKLISLGISPERVWNIGWITDFSRFLTADGAALREHYLEKPYERLVLFMGRLVPQKDPFTLIRVAQLVHQKHPEARFLIVGEGPLECEIKADIHRRDLQNTVILPGSARYDDVPIWMAAADIVALTTVYEGNARVLAEAAASARPTVTADVSGSDDTVLNGETGYVVPVREAHAFADRICDLLDDPARALAMGQRARPHILELYDERRLLDQFRELWRFTADATVG